MLFVPGLEGNGRSISRHVFSRCSAPQPSKQHRQPHNAAVHTSSDDAATRRMHMRAVYHVRHKDEEMRQQLLVEFHGLVRSQLHRRRFFFCVRVWGGENMMARIQGQRRGSGREGRK